MDRLKEYYSIVFMDNVSGDLSIKIILHLRTLKWGQYNLFLLGFSINYGIICKILEYNSSVHQKRYNKNSFI
jgi:hypothetical protein